MIDCLFVNSFNFFKVYKRIRTYLPLYFLKRDYYILREFTIQQESWIQHRQQCVHPTNFLFILAVVWLKINNNHLLQMDFLRQLGWASLSYLLSVGTDRAGFSNRLSELLYFLFIMLRIFGKVFIYQPHYKKKNLTLAE